ncbi:MAG: AAA family ATPase [Gammaproteobacteria bacterium]|jgi:MSHA biogenesis protein MshM
MYLEHFRLNEYPFTLTPDTGFFFDHGHHREALDVLVVALLGGEGFIKVTGEVGTGKTLLCRQLLHLLELDERAVTAYIPNPCLNPAALRLALAEELGISVSRKIGQHRLMQLLNERLLQLCADDRPVIVLLDEAQAMPDESLEAIRLLTNLETEKRKLLQVVLFGQPELDQHLAGDHLRQLRQRISFSYELKPLDHDLLGTYVQHRLEVAGYQGAPLFSPRAIRELHRRSGGIPRLVNLLCHKSLMAAYGCGATRVGRRHLVRAARDTEEVAPARVPWFAVLSGLLGFVALTGASMIYAYTL